MACCLEVEKFIEQAGGLDLCLHSDTEVGKTTLRLGSPSCPSSGEAVTLLPVVANILKFSPEEQRRCQAAASARASSIFQVPQEGGTSDPSAADYGSVLTGWTSWAFGSEPTNGSGPS